MVRFSKIFMSFGCKPYDIRNRKIRHFVQNSMGFVRRTK